MPSDSNSVNMKASQNSLDSAIVLISNSKIRYETQEYSWLKNGYKVNQNNYENNSGFRDCCRRIDYFKLASAIRQKHGLKHLEVHLYGSQPPNLEKVQKNMQRAMKNVKIYHKSPLHGEHKRTVTTLVAETVERFILFHQNQNTPDDSKEKCLILLGGDEDMFPLVEVAQQYGWKVRVWAYRTFMPSSSKFLERSEIELVPFEDYFESITYNKWEYKTYFKPEAELMSQGFVITFKPQERTFWGREAREITEKQSRVGAKFIELTSQVLHLPTFGCFLDPDEKTRFFVFIPIRPQIKDKDGRPVVVYDFDSHIASKFDGIKELINKHPGMDPEDTIPTCDKVLTYRKYLQTPKKKREHDKEIASSDPCRHKFWCLKYSRCYGNHTKEEIEYYNKYRESMPRESFKRKYYKTAPCNPLYCKLCEDEKDKLYLCSFSHVGQSSSSGTRVTDLRRCMRCKKEGHFRKDCTN